MAPPTLRVAVWLINRDRLAQMRSAAPGGQVTIRSGGNYMNSR